MTEVQALKKTIVIFHWLSIHPDKSKEDAYEVFKMTPDLFDCPLCEFAARPVPAIPEPSKRHGKTENEPLKIKHQLVCSFCPLRDFWPKAGCSDPASVYTLWISSRTPSQIAHAARQIAEAAQARLKEITHHD